jgi:hypothetical protein
MISGLFGLKSESCSELNSESMMSSENRAHFSASCSNADHCGALNAHRLSLPIKSKRLPRLFEEKGEPNGMVL